MILTITGIYAAILGIGFIALRTIVIIERAKSKISIFHQDNMILAEKIRRFGNFTEVVPHALILMGLVELFGGSSMLIHSIGGLLLTSRLLHPFGLNAQSAKNPLRIVSGVMTSAVFIIAIGYILWANFGH